jgi:hypothetical protein
MSDLLIERYRFLNILVHRVVDISGYFCNFIFFAGRIKLSMDETSLVKPFNFLFAIFETSFKTSTGESLWC